MKYPVARRLALFLIRFAVRLLPSSRAEWAMAMQSEVWSLKSDYRAALWAVGCVITGNKERVNAMEIGNLKTSRWVLVPEMALCFLPLTIAWWDSLFGVSGIVRLNFEVLRQFSIAPPRPPTASLCWSSCLLGPFLAYWARLDCSSRFG